MSYLLQIEANIREQLQSMRTVLLTKCYQRLVEEPDLSFLDDLAEDDKREAMLKMKDKRLGNVVFMGELFKNGLLAENVVHVCKCRINAIL